MANTSEVQELQSVFARLQKEARSTHGETKRRYFDSPGEIRGAIERGLSKQVTESPYGEQHVERVFWRFVRACLIIVEEVTVVHSNAGLRYYAEPLPPKVSVAQLISEREALMLRQLPDRELLAPLPDATRTMSLRARRVQELVRSLQCQLILEKARSAQLTAQLGRLGRS